VSNLGVDVIQRPRVAHGDGPTVGRRLLTGVWWVSRLAWCVWRGF